MDVFVIFEFILHAVNVVAFLIEVAVVVDGVLGVDGIQSMITTFSSSSFFFFFD